MKIDLTESEYRTLLEALARAAAGFRVTRFDRLRDNLRVRWERAADEQQKEAAK